MLYMKKAEKNRIISACELNTINYSGSGLGARRYGGT